MSLVYFQILLCVASRGSSRMDDGMLGIVYFHRAYIPRGGRFKEPQARSGASSRMSYDSV